MGLIKESIAKWRSVQSGLSETANSALDALRKSPTHELDRLNTGIRNKARHVGYKFRLLSEEPKIDLAEKIRLIRAGHYPTLAGIAAKKLNGIFAHTNEKPFDFRLLNKLDKDNYEDIAAKLFLHLAKPKRIFHTQEPIKIKDRIINRKFINAIAKKHELSEATEFEKGVKRGLIIKYKTVVADPFVAYKNNKIIEELDKHEKHVNKKFNTREKRKLVHIGSHVSPKVLADETRDINQLHNSRLVNKLKKYRDKTEAPILARNAKKYKYGRSLYNTLLTKRDYRKMRTGRVTTILERVYDDPEYGMPIYSRIDVNSKFPDTKMR